MENKKAAPKTLGATEGETLSVMGGNYRILVSGKETGGAFATIEMMVPPGGGPGPHAHPSLKNPFTL